VPPFNVAADEYIWLLTCFAASEDKAITSFTATSSVFTPTTADWTLASFASMFTERSAVVWLNAATRLISDRVSLEAASAVVLLWLTAA